jgi:hypothetical protein
VKLAGRAADETVRPRLSPEVSYGRESACQTEMPALIWLVPTDAGIAGALRDVFRRRRDPAVLR